MTLPKTIVAAVVAALVISACTRGPTLSRPVTQSDKDTAMRVYCSEVYAFTKRMMMEERRPAEMIKEAKGASMKAAEKVARRLNVSVEEAMLIINLAVDEHSSGDGAAAYCESR